MDAWERRSGKRPVACEGYRTSPEPVPGREFGFLFGTSGFGPGTPGQRMKHATSRMLFAYWDALRGERAAPERADVRPGDIRHILADTFVLGREQASVPIIRLAGTRCCALFGQDLKGKPFSVIWGRSARIEATRLADLVFGETVGLVAGTLGTNVNRSELALELLLLPLRHRGRTDSRLIGALSPASLPSWAGLVPLVSLEIRSIRIIEPARPPATEDDSGRSDSAERRQLFVVHEGGRS